MILIAYSFEQAVHRMHLKMALLFGSAHNMAQHAVFACNCSRMPLSARQRVKAVVVSYDRIAVTDSAYDGGGVNQRHSPHTPVELCLQRIEAERGGFEHACYSLLID